MKKTIIIVLLMLISLLFAETNTSVSLGSKNVFFEVDAEIMVFLSDDWIKATIIDHIDDYLSIELKGISANSLLINSLENNNLPMFFYILEESSGDILPFLFELEYYAKSFNKKSLLLLIDKIKKEKIKKESLIVQSIVNNNYILFKNIIENKKDISQEIIDRAYYLAVRARNFKFVDFLLKNNFKNNTADKINDLYEWIFKDIVIIDGFVSLENKTLFNEMQFIDPNEFAYLLESLTTDHAQFLKEDFENTIVLLFGYMSDVDFSKTKYFLEKNIKKKLFYFIGLLMRNNLERLESFILANKEYNYNNILFPLQENDSDADITSFIFICSAKNVDLNLIKRLVVDYGADINKKDSFGATAIIYAIECNNIDIVKYLLSQKAKINYEFIFDGNRYSSVLAFAKEKKNQNIVNLLIKDGAK